MTILDALRDAHLFGGLRTFADLTSWRAWLVFLAAVYGLPLDAEGKVIFCRHTGRTVYDPPPDGWPEVACITGRQSGKTKLSALVAGYEAATARRDGDSTYALMIAQDQRGSQRTLLRYARSPFDHVPMFQQSVTGSTADSLTLDNGVTLAAYPCRPAAVRGLRARVVVLDEIAFYVSGEGVAVDREMLRAVRPTVATTGGKILILSSPYAQTGVLYEMHKRHFGRDDSPVLVWQASAPDMNPTLPADYLERMKEEDPEAYRSEVLGEFRTGLSSLFDPEALDAVVIPDRRELAPVDGVTYSAFCDPSGGRADAFTLAIGHKLRDVAVVDVARAWKPPLNPAGVVEEAAELLKTYRIREVTGDRYAGEWPREAFRSQGITYTVAERPKSELYLAMVAAVNSTQVELLDLPELLRELRGLERRRGPSGKDRVDHRAGGHDDLANAVAGVVAILIGRARVTGQNWIDLVNRAAAEASGATTT